MTFPTTCQTADADPASAIAAQEHTIAALEQALWQHGFDPAHLPAYQAAWRRLETLIAAQGADLRHEFVIVIPVADRPQHLRSCLESLWQLCLAYGYGGMAQGRYQKITVLVADDSKEAPHLASNLALAQEFSARGLHTICFGPEEQKALFVSLGEAQRTALLRVLGNPDPNAFGHKGQGVMRNFAYLHLAARHEPGRRVLYYSIDSDQEFQVKINGRDGSLEAYALNFFYHLDEIFRRTNALVLTGKVVGDPPVSPAVMTRNFLDDVLGFLQQMAQTPPGPCRHHQPAQRREGEAAYHDMAELFGYQRQEIYHYPCPLAGPHGDADCLAHFAARLNSFFYGEHPTRASYYVHQHALASVQPARTVYAGNYIFRPEALSYFIPFASLRLRMSGPTLGRLMRAELGPRFVSANLPMLHKRTVEGTGQSEFRPGIATETHTIDFGDEFERQFYGDVMLFSIERLTSQGYPEQPAENIPAVLAAVREDMLEKYNQRREAIMSKLAQLEDLLRDPAQWWQHSPEHAPALAHFTHFIRNITYNFGPDSHSHRVLNDADSWTRRQTQLLAALQAYPQDRQAWEAAVSH